MADTLTSEVTVDNDLGIHLRVAGKLVDLTSRYQAQIVLRRGARQADGKSIMSVLALGVTKGDSMVIEATGNDAAAALEALTNLINNKFNES